MLSNQTWFLGGGAGAWRVLSLEAVRGAPLAGVTHVDVVATSRISSYDQPTWALSGLVSNVRYATRAEITVLRQRQAPLGRPEARRAALIPIRKSAAWWDLAQDERRAVFEETSHHTAIGLDYLPAIARQLFHCRDRGEPFDFLTWFEYAPQAAADFERLVERLRATPEWTFVEREVDIRLELV